MGELEDGPVTPGQIRRKALVAGDLWVGECHVTAPVQPSQRHHHKDFDICDTTDIRTEHGYKSPIGNR